MIICLGPVCVPIWGLLPIVLYFFPKFAVYLDKAPAWVQWCCRGGRSAATNANNSSSSSDKINDYDFASQIKAERREELDSWAEGRCLGIAEVETEIEFRYLKRKTLGAQRLLVADWGASWCAPCRKMEPRVKALAAKYARELVVVKLDLDKLQEFSATCQIAAVPTFIAYGTPKNKCNEQDEVLRVVGASADELEEKLAPLAGIIANIKSRAPAEAGTGADHEVANMTGASKLVAGGKPRESTLVKCTVDPKFFDAVVATVEEYRLRHGGEWVVSACRSSTHNSKGDLQVGLVICSGEMCKMINAVVSENGKVLSM